jgi:hypothetical protein
MNNYKIAKFGGITTYCDGFVNARKAYGEYNQLCYASFFGDAEQCKATVAGLVDGKELLLERDDCFRSYYRHQENMTFKTVKLETGIHTVVYCPILMDLNSPSSTKVVVGRSSAECHDKIFKILQKNRTTPLLPEWKERILDEMEIITIPAFGFPCARMVKLLNEEALETYVREHVRELARISNL